MRNFLKGIVVGIGGIAPGLSGSVLLVIFGLYEKTVNAIGTLFKHFKKNLAFLVPLFLGFGIGVLAFSKVIDFSTHAMLFWGWLSGRSPCFSAKSGKTASIGNTIFSFLLPLWRASRCFS